MSCVDCRVDFFTGQMMACRRCREIAHHERVAALSRPRYQVVEVPVEVEVPVPVRRPVSDFESALIVGGFLGAVTGGLLAANKNSKGNGKGNKKR